MKIEQTFVLEAAPDRVWAFLTDPYQVASCLPGAAITERIDDRTWRGAITVKVGPVTTSYKGTIRFERLDGERWEAELLGQGQDVKGRGGAEMRMQSRLRPTDHGTEITVVSEVSISGLLAQLGRGMIESVSTQIFRQFAAAMQQKLATAAGSGQADAGATPAEPKPLNVLSLGAKAVGQAVKRALGGEAENP
ncbi:MAG TPA: SRPBCC family protein [Methylomirabilota bacterium]|nr:SRPBCC family protein [Methylomirabilota bacterium]